MNLTPAQLQDLLVRPGHTSQEEFDRAVKEAGQYQKDLQEIIVEKGLIQDYQLGKLIAESQGYQFVDLKNQQIDDQLVEVIPESVARGQQIIAFAQTDQGIKVGMVEPNDLETINLISKRTGLQIIPYLITKLDLYSALSKYKQNLKKEIDQLLRELDKPDLDREKRNHLIVKLVDMLLKYGFRSAASDIHIEPQVDHALVRLRIDGVMHDVLHLPRELSDHLLTRIKVMARMRIDEHHTAQDSKLKADVDGERLDVRVSVVPVTKGENIVMRLLAVQTQSYTLSSLGLANQELAKVHRAAKLPQGMILVTGPTGSGKTTTVYAVVKILNIREVHIATIEDPVEYDIKGVTQIQVNPETNLTFAEGLRAIVRQDPDIIGVGEIRDRETASIAVNSAMTGHLVLSTIHANDSGTTLLRLIDMGIEPFLVASTVKLIIAQRLVRKICTVCRQSYQLNDEDRRQLKVNWQLDDQSYQQRFQELINTRLYKGAGCEVCEHTGYKGRVGIFEVLEVKDNINQLVMKRTSVEDITKVAKQNGMITMFEDGLNKVKMGITTLEEVLRVINE